MRCVRGFKALAVAAAVLPAAAWAGQFIVNGVPIGRVEIAVQGLDGVAFEKCTSIKIDNGTVRAECPGYDLQSAGGSAPVVPDAPIVPGRITKKYWIVTEQTQPGGETQYDVDMYVNSKWIKRFKNDDEQIVFEVTKYLTPGKNKVLFAPTKNLTAPRKSQSPNVYYRFVLGEGEMSGANVMIDTPVIDLKITAAETANTPKAFELVAR